MFPATSSTPQTYSPPMSFFHNNNTGKENLPTLGRKRYWLALPSSGKFAVELVTDHLKLVSKLDTKSAYQGSATK